MNEMRSHFIFRLLKAWKNYFWEKKFSTNRENFDTMKVENRQIFSLIVSKVNCAIVHT